MSNLNLTNIEEFFTQEDVDEFNQCTPISYSKVAFNPKQILLMEGRQQLKSVLSRLFRAEDCPQKGTASEDNWYCFYLDKSSLVCGCLYEDYERSNAVLGTLQHIKADTGFGLPYVLIPFTLTLDVPDRNPEPEEFTVTEKYMHYLGQQAALVVLNAAKQLSLPNCSDPTLLALITDESSEVWQFYIVLPASRFDLSNWNGPDEDLLVL